MALEIAHGGELERSFAAFRPRSTHRRRSCNWPRPTNSCRSGSAAPCGSSGVSRTVSIVSSEGRWPLRLMLIGLSSSAPGASIHALRRPRFVDGGCRENLVHGRLGRGCHLRGRRKGRRPSGLPHELRERVDPPDQNRDGECQHSGASGDRSRQRVQNAGAGRQKVDALITARHAAISKIRLRTKIRIDIRPSMPTFLSESQQVCRDAGS